MAEPTAYEQYMLELLNRARANPDGEASRLNGISNYNGDLNEGLTPGTISSSAKQPLAFNLNLIDAAKNQSDWMLANDMANFSDRHNRIPNGQTTAVNTPAQRMAAAGYATLGSFTSGENLARSWGSNPFDLTITTEDQHNNLFIDEGVPDRGHRTNMMEEDWREVGISVVAGGPITQGGQSFANSVVSTQNFAFIPNTDPFLTGVAFRDTDDNDFYTPGEGLGDVTININGVTNPAFVQSLQTMAAGGYQIQLAAGQYSVEFLRDGSVVQAAQTITISSENVKLDLLQEVGTNPNSGTGKIVGNKFNDANSNGVWDTGESGLAGWTIYLDANGNRQLDGMETSTTTDVNGEYIFNNLTPGTYNVAEVLQTGWTQTFPDPSNPIGSESYQLDSGQTSGAGIGGWGNPFVALNSFSVQTGLETIDSITVALRSSGNPTKVLLYSDPNGDGNPNDAVKLAEVDTTLTGTSGFASVALPTPINVSGDFFVGALYANGQFVPTDTNATDLGKSVFAVGIDNDADLDSLSDEFISPASDNFAGQSNFLLRANSPGALPNIVTVAADQTVANVNFGNECFLTGTRILTEKGEIAVENLEIGDKVQTAEGKLESVKWVGKQTCHPHQVKNPLRSYPILIKAGALGNNLPHRDLYVSPDHAMFFEGLLINAGALVNDISIVKTEPQETFFYYHVELENHALLLAEGASAESYLPQKENREDYDNGAEYEELYPHGSNLMLWPMDYPRVSSWVKVPRYVRKKLNSIAAQFSHQMSQLSA